VSEDPQEFARGRHLALATAALVVYLLITQLGWQPLAVLGLEAPWHGSHFTMRRCLHLLAVAVPAWLAFVALDTNSGVELLGARWREIGWVVMALCVVFLVAQVTVYIAAPDEVLRRLGAFYRHFETAGGIAWGGLIVYFLISALTEELLFRALIQRALEGYLDPPYAIAIQALLFELIHVLHGSSLTGGFFFGGVVFGLAFTRTRNLGLVCCLHLAGNVVHAILFAAGGGP
jgi:membrane protease YdiL (CAAX protease family)